MPSTLLTLLCMVRRFWCLVCVRVRVRSRFCLHVAFFEWGHQKEVVCATESVCDMSDITGLLWRVVTGTVGGALPIETNTAGAGRTGLSCIRDAASMRIVSCDVAASWALWIHRRGTRAPARVLEMAKRKHAWNVMVRTLS